MLIQARLSPERQLAASRTNEYARSSPDHSPPQGGDTVQTVQDELNVLRRAAAGSSYTLIESLMSGQDDEIAFVDDEVAPRAEFTGSLPEMPLGKPPLPPQAQVESSSGAWTAEHRSRRRHGSPVLSDDEAARVEAAALRSRFELGHVDTPDSFRQTIERTRNLVTNAAVDERTRRLLAGAVIAKLLHQKPILPDADRRDAALKLVASLDEEAALQANVVGQLVLGSGRIFISGGRHQAELFHEIQSLSTNIEVEEGTRLSLLANGLRNLETTPPPVVTTELLHELRDAGLHLVTRATIPVKTRMAFIANACAADNLKKLGFRTVDRRILVEAALDLLPQHAAAPGPAIIFALQLAHAARGALALRVDETIPFVNHTLSIISQHGAAGQKVAALEAFMKTVDHYRVHGNFDMLPRVAARRAHAVALSLARSPALTITQRTVALRILMRATLADIDLPKAGDAHDIRDLATACLTHKDVAPEQQAALAVMMLEKIHSGVIDPTPESAAAVFEKMLLFYAVGSFPVSSKTAIATRTARVFASGRFPLTPATIAQFRAVASAAITREDGNADEFHTLLANAAASVDHGAVPMAS